jgi:hypothetical protein
MLSSIVRRSAIFASVCLGHGQSLLFFCLQTPCAISPCPNVLLLLLCRFTLLGTCVSRCTLPYHLQRLASPRFASPLHAQLLCLMCTSTSADEVLPARPRLLSEWRSLALRVKSAMLCSSALPAVPCLVPTNPSSSNCWSCPLPPRLLMELYVVVFVCSCESLLSATFSIDRRLTLVPWLFNVIRCR